MIDKMICKSEKEERKRQKREKERSEMKEKNYMLWLPVW